uniref:Uncharacterized protein n=1 Tax=Arundo donax TaxID=35708 RepID=A0A0A9AHX5_ARUDO
MIYCSSRLKRHYAHQYQIILICNKQACANIQN